MVKLWINLSATSAQAVRFWIGVDHKFKNHFFKGQFYTKYPLILAQYTKNSVFLSPHLPHGACVDAGILFHGASISTVFTKRRNQARFKLPKPQRNKWIHCYPKNKPLIHSMHYDLLAFRGLDFNKMGPNTEIDFVLRVFFSSLWHKPLRKER